MEEEWSESGGSVPEGDGKSCGTCGMIRIPGDPPADVRLDAAGVEEVLRNLGAMRGMLGPEIPRHFAMGERIEAVPDPVWVSEPGALMGHSLLHLRDPRYGWLHYVLPPHEARKLASFLLRQADLAEEGQAGERH